MASVYPMYVLPPTFSSSVSSMAREQARDGRDGEIYSPDSRTRRRKQSLQNMPTTNVVFTDPIAFRFLAEDTATAVVSERVTLPGYQVYIVEKWACSRQQPTFVINTYTGDPSHSVTVSVLKVPADERAWSPRLKLYFGAVSCCYVRKTETPLGTLLVTSLSSFPSDLNVIPAPSGDIAKHRLDFIVNEDLKRLGCSGRSGFTLSHPSPATQAKFYQLYKTTDRIDFYDAVVELVKQCQMALSIFDMLPAEYVDGLLCDLTEKAIGDWWTVIGTDLYNAEPNDGVLGPSTVAALLGTLLGARNRLHAYGVTVAKDVFDVTTLKRSIASFQKSQKLERSRRLDRQTLDRLHRCTAKAASGDAGWAVPRAVKSTVVELGGKGGEMVMGMVGGDKVGISEIETLDIERFVQLVYGERSKWLWHGKPRKTGNDVFRLNAAEEPMVFTQDGQGGYIWKSSKRERGYSQSYPTRHSLEYPLSRETSATSAAVVEEKEVERELKPGGEKASGGIKKSVSTKVLDAKAGLGRFRDAVGIPGLRSHHHKRSKEVVYEEEDGPTSRRTVSIELTGEDTAVAEPLADKGSPRYPEPLSGPGTVAEALSDLSRVSSRQDPSNRAPPPTSAPTQFEHDTAELLADAAAAGQDAPPDRRSDEGYTLAKVTSQNAPIFRNFQRSRSADPPPSRPSSSHRAHRLARHLSFSLAEQSILTWAPPTAADAAADGAIGNLDTEMARENLLVAQTQRLSARVHAIARDAAPWVEAQVAGVKTLDAEYQTRAARLQQLYQGKVDEFRALQASAVDVTAREGALVAEEIKKVELLGAKLDYEISVLQSKVADVEAGVADYEAHVVRVERRIKTIIGGEEKGVKTWRDWFRSICAVARTAEKS